MNHRGKNKQGINTTKVFIIREQVEERNVCEWKSKKIKIKSVLPFNVC